MTVSATFMAKSEHFESRKIGRITGHAGYVGVVPNNPVAYHGDMIKIVVGAPFFGPAVIKIQGDFITIQRTAHAVKNSGVAVDSKKKLVKIVKDDNMSNPDSTKKVRA